MSQNTVGTKLPVQFQELEALDEWILASDAERIDRRLSLPQSALIAFYDAMSPHVLEIMAYLRERPVDDVSPEDQALLSLMYSLMDISIAVEIYRQGSVTGGGDLRDFIPKYVSWMK